MAYYTVKLDTEKEIIEFFVNFAWYWNRDLDNFPDFDLDQLFQYCQVRYKLVSGEQVIRPRFYENIGGDCDNCLVFVLSFLFNKYGKQWVQKNVAIVEAGRLDFSHIFLTVGNITFDPTPPLSFDEEADLPLKRSWGIKNNRSRFTIFEL